MIQKVLAQIKFVRLSCSQMLLTEQSYGIHVKKLLQLHITSHEIYGAQKLSKNHYTLLSARLNE